MADEVIDRLTTAESEAALIELLAHSGVGPGWAKSRPSIYPQPHRSFVPARWRHAEASAALQRAAAFVGTDRAERRNLIMINPHDGNDYATARTLVAAYQLVKAGEAARSHRHVPNALRLAVDTAPGTFTIVDGARIPMEPGDVLLTPNWRWHGHKNEASSDALWIDFLDVPLIHLLEPMFFEQHPDWLEPAGAPEPLSPLRFAYSRTGPAVRAAAETRGGERWLPLGPYEMPTIGLALRHFAAGTGLGDPRTTENRIYAVIEGEGVMTAENRGFGFTRGDTLVVPAWTPCHWQADAETVLLCVSDRPMLEALGLWRTEDPV
jgi:gentisate 1,2-dioxygenase